MRCHRFTFIFSGEDHLTDVAKLRRYRCASGWLAIVALLGNVLAAFVPAKAAQIVDDILGPGRRLRRGQCASPQP